MPKIIIDYPEQVSNIAALNYVQSVVRQGKVSEARGYKKYCHATVFKVESLGNLVVYCRDKRKNDGPDSFDVRLGTT